MFIAESDLPLPYEYRFLPLDGPSQTRRPDLDERTIVFLDCGNIERNPAAERLRPADGWGHILNIDHHHDNTRFGTRQLRRPECLVHGGDGLGSGACARGRADADDRRGAVRRPDHRYRLLHVREHRPARAPDGRRADRGRR